MNLRFVIVLLAALLGWYLWTIQLGSEAPGALAGVVDAPATISSAASIDRNPIQIEVDGTPPVVSVNRFNLSLVADFELEARVLGRRDYRFGTEAALSPMDLALGWGPMARDEVLESIDIRQRNRFFYWSTPELPIPRQDIIAHSSNMHLIPANDEAWRQLKQVSEDSIVRLSGYLVNIDRDDGWRWRTSLRRDDSGHGACEIVLVTLAEVL